LCALFFGLFPWTRLMFDLNTLPSAPREVAPYVLLVVAATRANQSIAVVVAGIGLFLVWRNWRGKPERTVLLGLVERQLAAEVARQPN
jgi:hypothetical protein